MLLKTEWERCSGFSLPPAFQSLISVPISVPNQVKSGLKLVDEEAWETVCRAWSLCIHVEQGKAGKDLETKGTRTGTSGAQHLHGLPKVFKQSQPSGYCACLIACVWNLM